MGWSGEILCYISIYQVITCYKNPQQNNSQLTA